MKSFYTVALGTIVMVSAFLCSYLQIFSADTSDLMYANIEALAAGEGDTSCSASANCYSKEYDSSEGKWMNILIGTVSCTGKEECTSGNGYVICDGTTASCE